ncbi:MAG: DNA translocase FtsK [Treponema sp.]|nr:DNA translocase FtsK [Treponema sp.]
MNSEEDMDFSQEDLESKKENMAHIRQMNDLEQTLISETEDEDKSAVEKSRSFLEDIVDSQEDDDELSDDETDKNFEHEENLEEESAEQKKSEYSDSDEDDFGRTNSTFDIASDIFADMAEDAREQINSGKKPARFAQPEYESRTNSEVQESVYETDETNAQNMTSESKTPSNSPYETAEPPARTTIRTEPKQEGHRVQPKKPYIVPTDLMEQYKDDQYWIIDEETKGAAFKLEETLDQFGISAKVTGIKKGPVVTMFEIVPAPGVRLSKIVSLQDNIALSLAASSVRIVAPIPGKAAVGIEIPNKKRSIVSFREIIEQDIPEYTKMAIPVILGKDILGKSQIIDIAKTPHLLIAGATGAGKSVCVNSLILSILYKRSPRQVKMILVDPKVVELKLYNDIPHLLTPVITEPKKALQALQYCLCEMERRYALLDGLGVRDISNYNKRIEERNICTEKLPYIVVIIDEFADLMATSGRDLESIVARLTAMSRAVGIHLVLATQRPSVNVITGLIKANIPSRIAFMVSSRTDSNIIIDSVGAEKLLGKGDMLYASAVDPNPIRIQGTFESDNDVESVVNYVKTLGEPEYIDDEIFVDDEEEGGGGTGLFNDGVSDPLYEQALDIVIQSGKASASYLQRRLSIGYNRAARLVEEMEERGIVGPANGSKPREIIHVPG